MTATYRVLAYLICILVMVQAAAHAWAIAGLANWVFNEGGVFDQSTGAPDAPPPFVEVYGLMIHGMNGMMLIPLITVLLLVAALILRNRRAIVFAVALVVLVFIQVVPLAMMAFGTPVLTLLHGLNALLVFGVALLAARAELRPLRSELGAMPGARTDQPEGGRRRVPEAL